MPTITLPDGSQRDFDHPVSVREVAATIGSGLAKAALAGKVNGQLFDTAYVLEQIKNEEKEFNSLRIYFQFMA